jgi:hypothetical protein
VRETMYIHVSKSKNDKNKAGKKENQFRISPKKLKIKLSYDLAVTFMGIYLNKGKKIILSEISQTQKEKCHMFSLHVKSKLKK